MYAKTICSGIQRVSGIRAMYWQMKRLFNELGWGGGGAGGGWGVGANVKAGPAEVFIYPEM